jgi:hypothetical protein
MQLPGHQPAFQLTQFRRSTLGAREEHGRLTKVFSLTTADHEISSLLAHTYLSGHPGYLYPNKPYANEIRF